MQATVPPPPADEVPAVVLHDARAVHDTATLRLLEFAGAGQLWAVVLLKPGPASGSGTTPGGYINGETGESVDPPGARLVRLKNGAWQILAGSTEWGRSEGGYDWSDPVGEQKRKLDPDDYYSPFIHGGAILFHPGPQGSGEGQFLDPHLIFREWAARVGPAGGELQRHAALFGEKIELDQVAELARLARDSNPFLASEAFRQLIAVGRMPPPVIAEIFAAADEHLAALIAYLTIAYSDRGKTLAQTASASKLRELALGAFSLALLRSSETAVLARAKLTLRAVKRRLKEMHMPEDAYLSAMFDTAGIGR